MSSVKNRLKSAQQQGLNANELAEATKPVLVSVSVPESVPDLATGPSGGWRKFVTPPAARGTSQLTRRVNIPVTAEVLTKLASIDREVISEGGRWTLNRNELIAAAITELVRNADQWERTYLLLRSKGLDQSGVLQGRVTSEVGRQMLLERMASTGRRAVGPLLGVVVSELLTS